MPRFEMETCQYNFDCDACPERLVCHCLGVTEEELVCALTTLNIRTVKEIRELTGAGNGCTACTNVLRGYLQMVPAQASAEPICSVK
jgi:bacterioferritin-associated ferredoxin